jgi:glycosyltransferase involved in cell wall biosynthesis
MAQVKSIALLLDSAPRAWTSQEEIHLRLCRALKAKGIQPVLVYAKQLSPELENRFASSGAKIEVITYTKGVRHYYGELGRLIRRYEIGMVQVCFFNYFSLIPWLARLHGIRLIIFEELNSGVVRAVSWKRKLLQLRTFLAAVPFTHVLAISKFVKDDLINRGIGAERISVRYLGVDEQRFRPEAAERERWLSSNAIDADELLLSTVAVLRPFKHPDVIVRAVAILKQRGIRFRLLVAGDGVMLPELKELSKQLDVAENIHWLGYCQDPTSLLQASDVFILSSVGEAFGLVMAEAMACGAPVVGSRSGAIPEVVEEGQTGLLATPLDEVSFANALETLAKDDQLRKTMGQNSRLRVLERFTVDREVDETMRIYESLWSN